MILFKSSKPGKTGQKSKTGQNLQNRAFARKPGDSGTLDIIFNKKIAPQEFLLLIW
jgi:hypothetical protein